MTIRTTARQSQAFRLFTAPDVRYCLAVGGSRSGKTFLACDWLLNRGHAAPGSRHLVLRKYQGDAKRAVGGDTLKKVYGLLGLRSFDDAYGKQEGVLRLSNGAEIWLAGLDTHNLEKVLGNEYATIFVNEASQIPFDTFEVLRTRLAQRVAYQGDDSRYLPLRMLVDLNPTTRAHWTYRLWIDGVHPETGEAVDQGEYAHCFMNPADNLDNLPVGYVEDLAKLGPRKRKRFLDGEYSADAENALWSRVSILRTERRPETLDRIVIAVDPAISNEPGSDETGIIACGMERADSPMGYVLADESGRWSPREWARAALSLWRDMDADCIVAEANQGGDMVEATIRAHEADYITAGRLPPRVKLVKATKGKAVRAEPVAGLYDRQRVYHAGRFDALEDQMCSFTTGFDRTAEGYSPDRVDALVWGFTELFGKMTERRRVPKAPPRVPTPRGGSWMAA